MNEGWTRKKIRASDCVDYAFTYARREFKALIPIVLLFQVPFIFLINMMLNTGTFVRLIEEAGDDGFAALKLVLLVMGGITLFMIYYGILAHIANGAIIYSAYRYTMFGERPGLKASCARGAKLLLWNMLFSFITGAVISVLFLVYTFAESAIISTASSFKAMEIMLWIGFAVEIIVVIVIIYIELRFSYMPQFVVAEDMNLFSALKASWRATKGRMKRIFCIYVVGFLVSSSINTAVTALSVLNVYNSNFIFTLVGAVISVFAALGYFIYSLSITFSYMHDISDPERIKKEQEIYSYLKENEV